jgi:hypothetical protein
MKSVVEFATRVGFGNHPVSVRSVVRKFAANSLHDAIATHGIKDFHRRTGADFGPLGVPRGGVTKAADGSYQQEMQLGSVHVTDFSASPLGETEFIAEVTLAGVRCFGTQDNGPDETYAIISLFSINPNHGGTDKLVKTVRTEIQDNVRPGDTIFKMRTLGDLVPVGGGIGIHIAIWDHESGDADEIRDKIAAAIEEAAQKGAAALAAGAASDDPAVSAGTIGKVTDFELAGVKPFHLLTLGIAGLISHALADDLVGEQFFFIPAANIADLADQTKFNASIRKSPDLPFDVQLNWPPRPEDEPLFTDGKGTYKAYLLLKGGRTSFPVNPGIP